MASDGSEYMVCLDLNSCSYDIEHAKGGRLIEDRISNPLRRSRVKQFKEELEKMAFLNWSVIASFPEYCDSTIDYAFDWEEENAFYTEADGDVTKIRTLHKLLEQLIGHTFGSYTFYED